jgi:hypothetical protein
MRIIFCARPTSVTNFLDTASRTDLSVEKSRDSDVESSPSHELLASPRDDTIPRNVKMKSSCIRNISSKFPVRSSISLSEKTGRIDVEEEDDGIASAGARV